MIKPAFAAFAGAAVCVLSPGVAAAVPDYPCGSAHGWNVAAYGATCGFAFSLAQSFNSGEIVAYSPVTGLNYSFSCKDASRVSGYAIAYECNIWSERGGVVYLWND